MLHINTDIYKERIQQLETPTKLPLPFLSCPTLNELRTAISEFGEVKECKLDYSLKKQPVLAVGKGGSAENELYCPAGLALDEVNQLIYIADWWNSRIQVVSFKGKFLKRFGSVLCRCQKPVGGIVCSHSLSDSTSWRCS